MFSTLRPLIILVCLAVQGGAAVRALAGGDPPAPAVPATQNDAIQFGKNKSSGSSTGLNGGDWLHRTGLAVALVVGLIFAAAYVVKRWAPGPVGQQRSGVFRVCGRWHLSGRQYVTLVQVGRRLLLLGVTGQQISLLADIADPREVEHLTAKLPGAHSILGDGFSQLLGRQSKALSDVLADDAAESAAAKAQSELSQLATGIKSRLSKIKADGPG